MIKLGFVAYLYCKYTGSIASVDPDQLTHVPSDQDHHCLLIVQKYKMYTNESKDEQYIDPDPNITDLSL
jgi:hypothetical protein